MGIAILAAIAAGGFALLSGQAGVDFAARELAVRSGGALEIDGATGSLLDTVRIRRLAWRGQDASAVAHDVALTWSPAALWSQGIVVRGLGARLLTLEFKPSTADVPLPSSLALPVELVIEHLAVGQLEWRLGASGGTIRGLAFGYAGGAKGHRLSDLEFVWDRGALSGNATIGADSPFPIAGRLAAKGDAAFGSVDASAELGGSLARTTLEGSGKGGAARVTGRAVLAPLALVPLREIQLDATGVDLAAIDATLPTTGVSAVVRASPEDGGLAGTIEATNAASGSIDQGKVPVTTLASHFTWRDDVLGLDGLVAGLAGGGRISGQGRLPLGTPGVAGNWSLDVRDADLRRLHARLVPTRLTGKIAADLEARQQRISAAISDRTIAGGLALDFIAQLADGVVTVERFRARADGGELAGRGRVATAGERAFDLEATATRFDPARFGDFPKGMLDGRIAATGALASAWRVHADITLAPDSRLAGVALGGTARGTVVPTGVRDATVDLAIGRAKLNATGSAADPGDRMTIALDAPEIAELAPFLPAAVPRPVSGALHARAHLHGVPPRAGIDFEATGRQLKFGALHAFGTLEVHASVERGTAADIAGDLAGRKLNIAVAAKEFVTPSGIFATMRAKVEGTLAQHGMTAAFVGEDLDVEVAAHGGVIETREAGAEAVIAWNGTLDALENRGKWALRLVAPASLQVSRTHVRVGATRIAVADGSVNLTELAWDDGRITTQGSFTSVPIATAARLAGVRIPFVSTLTLGGEWSLAATPRLNGTATVRREGGDVWLTRNTASEPGLAAGISRLEAAARFTDDAIDATAAFRSSRGGTADATLAIGTVANAPPGRLAPDAPLALAIRGDIASLQLLQPWIGTAFVVDGRAKVELAASGTVSRAPLSGSLVGEGLRIDAPQYGLHFTDGRLVGRAADGRVVIDELTLKAGAGVFRASGEITELAPGGARPTARLAWQAEEFRVFNRPDLRLVVGGEGTVATRNGKLALSGKLKADEGTIVYLTTPDATLGDDVVVKGWPRRTADTRRDDDIALDVDLELDLGRNLRFSGEGLETDLEGQVRVTNSPAGLVGRGSIRAVNGTYFAFGQKLTIDRGRLIFDGRLDNPGLDIVALRKNLAVEAGVAITGTVKVPIIQLTSNPPMPDSEKLSWLVLGHGLDRTTGTDFGALQAASAALLGQQGKPITATIAQSIGLDDISIKSATGTARGNASGTPDTAGQVVTVGKRLSDRFSLVYEQGLTVATNALRLEYELTRSLTLRAEAGAISGVGVYFRRSFD